MATRALVVSDVQSSYEGDSVIRSLVGATDEVITAQIGEETDGVFVPLDLTDKSVYLKITDRYDGVIQHTLPCYVVDAETGSVSVSLDDVIYTRFAKTYYLSWIVETTTEGLTTQDEYPRLQRGTEWRIDTNPSSIRLDEVWEQAQGSLFLIEEDEESVTLGAGDNVTVTEGVSGEGFDTYILTPVGPVAFEAMEVLKASAIADLLNVFFDGSFVDYPLTSIPALEASAGSVNALRTVSGTRGGRFKWAASGTVDNVLSFAASGGGVWNRIWNFTSLDAAWAGLSEDATAAENTAALHLAADVWALTGGELVVPPGDFSIEETSIAVPNDGTFTQYGVFWYGGSGVALKFGVDGPDNDTYRPTIRGIRVVSDVRDFTPGRKGVELTNLIEGDIEIFRVEGFHEGLVCEGTNVDGFAYNQVRLHYLADNNVNLVLRSEGLGWCNENTFYGGRFGYSSAITGEKGLWHIAILPGPSSTLEAAASVGALSLDVKDASVFAALTLPFTLTLHGTTEGASEDVTVTAIVGNTLTLDAGTPLVNDYIIGVWATTFHYAQNNNHFINPSLESGATAEKARPVFFTGSFNHLSEPRLEGQYDPAQAGSIILGKDSAYCVVTTAYGGWRGSVIDHGARSHVRDAYGFVLRGGGGAFEPTLHLRNLTGGAMPAIAVGEKLYSVPLGTDYYPFSVLDNGTVRAFSRVYLGQGFFYTTSDGTFSDRGFVPNGRPPENRIQGKTGSLSPQTASPDVVTGTLWYKTRTLDAAVIDNSDVPVLDEFGAPVIADVGGWAPLQIVVSQTSAQIAALDATDVRVGWKIYDSTKERWVYLHTPGAAGVAVWKDVPTQSASAIADMATGGASTVADIEAKVNEILAALREGGSIPT